MFDRSIDDRLSAWMWLRSQVNHAPDPLLEVWDFWKRAPFVPYNNKIDPYHQRSWPTPWDIIVENRYDDFTKALMIGWTLKLSERYQNSKIEIKTLVDNARTRQYNIVCIDEEWMINFSDDGPETMEKFPHLFLLENLIELQKPR
jgi:hypothetical protein